MSELRGAHLHLDCASGIAGDMALAALLDLGVPEDVVRGAIEALGLPGIGLAVSTVRRGEFVGKRVEVLSHGRGTGDAHGPVTRGEGHDHVRYAAIRERILARCDRGVQRWALAIFDAIAAVEARRHGVALADVAFHELGAADSIADIVGCAAALTWLAPSGVSCRAVPLGGGTVHTAHGRVSVPAPATLELLRGCVVESGGTAELTTPTGAAIVRALLDETPGGGGVVDARFGPMPTGHVLGVGWGAGTRELADRPNLLRVVAVVPRTPHEQDEVELYEANVDDLPPNLAAPLVEALLAAGALDAWLTPIVMKKGRPALLVSALAPPGLRRAIEEVFFRESTTIGLRRSGRVRTVLARQVVEVPTALGPIAVKLAGRADASGTLVEVYSATPELEACRRVAVERGLPLRRVYEIAAAAAASRRTS